MPEIPLIVSSLISILDLMDRLQNRGLKTPAEVEEYNAKRNEVRKQLVALLTATTPTPEQPASNA